VAAVYEGARLEAFDGAVLQLSFPEELAIYVKLAGEPKRLDPLQEVLAKHLGTSPRLEFRVADGASGDVAPVQEEPSRQVTHRAEPGEHRADTPETRDIGGERSGLSGATEDTVAEGRAPGGTVDDGIIRDQREIFEMARERFGLFGQDRGS
jgi:hypothetical protein